MRLRAIRRNSPVGNRNFDLASQQTVGVGRDGLRADRHHSRGKSAG
jgi:hypothetical protein